MPLNCCASHIQQQPIKGNQGVSQLDFRQAQHCFIELK